MNRNLLKFIALFLISFSSLFAKEANVQQPIFSGNGYALGLQHGRLFKKEIGEIVDKWKINASERLCKDPDQILKEFFEYADFTDDIKKWTPELYEEIRGIAEGSGQAFNNIFVLNLLDEFWVYIDDISNHHCSIVGVPALNNNPTYIAQNMDIEKYTNGYQIVMRLLGDEMRPEQLILTHPGLIGLIGMNAAGVGVCVNTLMQLKAAAKGLPVAFIVRQILNTTNKDELFHFITSVPHASGQNYFIGIQDEVFDFEASANKVVLFNLQNKNGVFYHTNHPLINDDVKTWFCSFAPNLIESRPLGNSDIRLESIKKRVLLSQYIDDETIKNVLRSRDDQNNPICRSIDDKSRGFTFASVLMTLTGNINLQMAAGPPNENQYQEFKFPNTLN